jgi:hypothetical protein
MRLLLLDRNLQRHSVWQSVMRLVILKAHVDLQEHINMASFRMDDYDAYVLHSNNRETDLILEMLAPESRVMVFSGGYTQELLQDEDYSTWWYVKLEYLQLNFAELITQTLMPGGQHVA